MKTLILNSDYKPLSVVNSERAIILDLYNSNITSIHYYDKTLKSEKSEIKIPSVMLYSRFISIKRDPQPSKRNIRARDRNKCGYCGIVIPDSQFTVDHIIPVSRYSKKRDSNTWENLVSSCRKCNSKKADRTPLEAGMKLLVKPKRPYSLVAIDRVPAEWEPYL